MVSMSEEDRNRINEFEEEYASLATEIAKMYLSKKEIELLEQSLQGRVEQWFVERDNLHETMTKKYGDRFFEEVNSEQ